MKPIIATFQNAQARRKPRLVLIQHIKQGVSYTHTSKFLGTRNAQSYLPGARITNAVVIA